MACQTLIREADTRAADLRRVHDCEAGKYRRLRDKRLADTRYRQNSLLPMHKTPVELFSNILVMALDAAPKGSRRVNDVLRPLASVSKYWKEMVLSTPQAWSFLSDVMSETELRWSLHRSKEAPLDVSFSSLAAHDGGTADRYSQIVAALSG